MRSGIPTNNAPVADAANFFGALQNCFTSAVLIVDRNERIVACTPAAEKTLRLKPGKFVLPASLRKLVRDCFASAGYFYCSETAPDNFFTPAVPDTELHVGSIGVGHKGERWTSTVAGQLIAGPARQISSSPSGPPGTYQLFVPDLSFSVAYRF